MRDCPGLAGGQVFAPRTEFLRVRSPEPHEPSMLGSLHFAPRVPLPAAGGRAVCPARTEDTGRGAGMVVKPF